MKATDGHLVAAVRARRVLAQAGADSRDVDLHPRGTPPRPETVQESRSSALVLDGGQIARMFGEPVLPTRPKFGSLPLFC
jgi:hypothetical protein